MQNITAEKYFGFPITVKRLVEGYTRNEETGEVSVAPRVVLIDDKGKAYQSVSVGIYSSLKNIMFVYGDPSTWEKPVKVKITQITKGKNKMLNLKVVA